MGKDENGTFVHFFRPKLTDFHVSDTWQPYIYIYILFIYLFIFFKKRGGWAIPLGHTRVAFLAKGWPNASFGGDQTTTKGQNEDETTPIWLGDGLATPIWPGGGRTTPYDPWRWFSHL
jgi:hypothetical protein